jgi:hypothetical protein
VADQANKNQYRDGKNALADYEAQAQAIRAKTERLRALRLAREAAEPPAAAKRAAPSKAKSAKAAKGGAATLSAWLQDQQNGGRRT